MDGDASPSLAAPRFLQPALGGELFCGLRWRQRQGELLTFQLFSPKQTSKSFCGSEFPSRRSICVFFVSPDQTQCAPNMPSGCCLKFTHNARPTKIHKSVSRVTSRKAKLRSFVLHETTWNKRATKMKELHNWWTVPPDGTRTSNVGGTREWFVGLPTVTELIARRYFIFKRKIRALKLSWTSSSRTNAPTHANRKWFRTFFYFFSLVADHTRVEYTEIVQKCFWP